MYYAGFARFKKEIAKFSDDDAAELLIEADDEMKSARLEHPFKTVSEVVAAAVAPMSKLYDKEPQRKVIVEGMKDCA
jgi:hypothetical protein